MANRPGRIKSMISRNIADIVHTEIKKSSIGLVSVNDRPVRASYEVKTGDRITLRFGVRTMTVEVLAVEESPRKDASAAMYRQI